MAEASLPTTRFSATELALGWAKVTVWPVPMLKLCQLMAVRDEFCVTVMELALGEVITALPATTTPPVGNTTLDADAAPPVPAKTDPTLTDNSSASRREMMLPLRKR